MAEKENRDAAGKVELDIEDAPFLKVEEEKSVASVPAVSESKPPAVVKQRFKNKKLLLGLAGGLLLVLVLAGVALWWFVSRSPAPPAPEPPAPDVVVVPSAPQVAVNTPDFVKEFLPFVVPLGQSIEKTRILVCKFSTVTKNATLSGELDKKMLAIRDAVYFYLHGKSPDFLTDPLKFAEIKKDLLAVVNNYLVQGKVEDVLFENYVNQ